MTPFDTSLPGATGRTFACTFGQGLTQTVWNDRRNLTWPALADLLTKHERGRKEGSCIVPATFRGTRRIQADADRIDLVVLDADCGHTLEEIETAVTAHGWACIIHSTHSHLTTTTTAKKSHWGKFFEAYPAGNAREFLIREKHYLPRVAEGARIGTVNGVDMTFEHQACPKFRIVLPLSRPWRAADYADQTSANADWKARIEALAAALGLAHDQSCVDANRLFYLPRYPDDGREPVARVIDGVDCDIWTLPTPAAPEQTGRLFTAKPTVAIDAGEYADPDTGEIIDLRAWARERGRQFEIVKALQARVPGNFVGHVADGTKYHIVCPNDDAHTTTGTDRATFVVNASDANNKGFAVHCRHAHCTGQDRLFFVRRMLERRWLTLDDLTAAEFLTAEDGAAASGEAPPQPSASEWAQWDAMEAEGILPPLPPPALFDPWDSLQPPDFPIDTLPAVLKGFVEDRARVIGADPCALAWGALSACSAALDGRIRLRMKQHDGWRVPPYLWLALVGAPSTKKTPILEAAWAPLRRAQAIDISAWKVEHDRWKGLSKKDRSETPEPVCRRRLITDSSTIEAIENILGCQDRGIAFFSDELTGWLGALEKYSPGRGGSADRAFFLQGYNGGSYVSDRVVRGTTPIGNLGVTVAGGIQPDRLRQLGDLTADGLWQRFVPIITAPASIGRDEEAGQQVYEYGALIERLLLVGPQTVVMLSEPARAVRVDVEVRLFEIEQSGALGPAFAAFCGKLQGVWGRLCLVLSQIEDDDVPFVVTERTAIMAGTLLFKSVLPNAARVYATMGGAGGNIEATRSVAGYILTKQKARVLASDLAHNVRACRGQPLEDVQRVVSPLVAGGWLTPEREFNPVAWIVHPAVHQRFADRAAKETERRATVRALLTGVAKDDGADAE